MRRGSKRNRLLDRWVGVPFLNLLAAVKVGGRMPEKPRRIGVLCSPALGDTLLFSGVLNDLRRHFDQLKNIEGDGVEIIHFCMRENLDAAELIEGADRRILINLQRPDESIKLLKAEQLDMMLDFSAWQRVTALHTMMSGAQFTVGFKSKGQFRGRAYDLAVEHRSDRHELENFRALVRALDIEASSEPRISIPDVNEVAWRESWRKSIVEGASSGLHGSEEMVVFHPWPSGAKSWFREWPSQRWIELALLLQDEDHSMIFVVSGGPEDQEQTQALVSELQHKGLRSAGFCGADGLKATVALLRRARLAVCVNTGIMHLAAIAGTPTIGLNGPTAEHRWGPRGRCVKGVCPEDGSGGYLNLGFEYPARPQDVMAKISVSQVLDAAADLMTLHAVR